MKSRIAEIILLAFIIGLASVLNAQTFTTSKNSIYADHKARIVGDVVTVLIVEFSKANNKSATSTSKNDGVSVDVAKGTGVLSFLPDAGFSASTNNTFTGQGATSRTGSLQGKMTATIMEILPNGYYRVEGTRVVEVNMDKQTMELSGTIRPRDIRADNTIYSYNIASATIKYSGKGAVNTGQRPGYIRRIINWIF